MASAVHGFSPDEYESIATAGADIPVPARLESDPVEEAGEELVSAACRSDLHTIRAYKGDINRAYGGGRNALREAAYYGQARAIRCLITEKSANVESDDLFGRTPVHIATAAGQTSIVKMLVKEFGANPMATHITGAQPLHFAVFFDRLAIINYLLGDVGADVSAQDSKGRSCLFYCRSGRALTVLAKAAWQAGAEADFHSVDEEDKRPMSTRAHPCRGWINNRTAGVPLLAAQPPREPMQRARESPTPAVEDVPSPGGMGSGSGSFSCSIELDL